MTHTNMDRHVCPAASLADPLDRGDRPASPGADGAGVEAELRYASASG